MTNLLQKQEHLQKEAQKALKSLGLFKILARYGKVEVVGSLALGLMVWPDIDLDLVGKSKINSVDYLEMIGKIFKKKNIKKLILIDNRAKFEKNRPVSMYIGIIYRFQNHDWKIDIRYLNKSAAWANSDVDLIKKKLDKNKIEAILRIKAALFGHPKYRKEFSAYDIYQAVLDERVTSVIGFKNFLKNKGVKL